MLPRSEQAVATLERIEEFRIVRLLGRGAQGAVYLAEDEVLQRSVALKVLAATGASSRIMEEAQAAARISHPNVAAVYRAGVCGEVAYLATELVTGVTLASLLPLSIDRCIEVGAAIAAGLDAAHRRGILHRDLKPANVMIAHDGTAKLVDFGLAAATAATEEHTEPTGEVEFSALVPMEGTVSLSGSHGRERSGPRRVGTPLYMAPELWSGLPATVGSDVYALGAMLHQMASGTLPHAATSLVELAESVKKRAAPRLVLAGGATSEAFADIVAQCLAGAPESRPASAAEVLALLSLLARGEAPTRVASNPYRGLAGYGVEDSHVFFGREAEAREITERMRHESLLILTGDSGVGKSSLARAGVVPAIERGALDSSRTWKTVEVVLGSHPSLEIERAIASALHLNAAEPAEEADAFARRVRDALSSSLGLVLLLDGLETLAEDPTAGREALALLERLSIPGAALRVIATLRGDRLTRIASLAPGDLSRALYVVAPLDEPRLRRAIVRPANMSGVRFDPPELVEELAREGLAESALPLLSFTLAEIWEARQDNCITRASIEAMGGVSGAVQRHADRVMAALGEPERAHAKRMLASLVDEHGDSHALVEEELVRNDETARAALSALVRGRLVVARKGESTRVELAHRALAHAWEALREWRARESTLEALARRLQREAREWDRRERDTRLHLSAEDVREMRRLDPHALGAVEKAFLRASARAVVLRRTSIAAMIALLPLVAVLTYASARASAARRTAEEVTREVSEARRYESEAAATLAARANNNAEAFARFDEGKREEGERVWEASRARAKVADQSLSEALRRSERALLLDAASPRARSTIADVLVRRATLFEALGREDEAADAIARLPLYDEGGERLRAWHAPGTLDATSLPEASLFVEQFVEAVHEGEIARWASVENAQGRGALTRTLAPGSYRLVADAPAHARSVAPFIVERGARVVLRAVLVPRALVPDGFVVVPPGAYLAGSGEDEHQRKDFLKAAPLHTRATAGYLIARHETTYGQWIEFLDRLSAAERAKRTPKASSVGTQGDVSLVRDERGWTLRLQPGPVAWSAQLGKTIEYPRATHAKHDWRHMPVTGVSLRDAETYVKWIAENGLRGARLCREAEWERAARGADGRPYPSGKNLADANRQGTYGPKSEALGPDEVGTHPASDSPFGVADMAGNAFELVAAEGEPESVAIVRGGSFAFDANAARAELREHMETDLRDITIGFRVCADY